jgi:hypothetical protein
MGPQTVAEAEAEHHQQRRDRELMKLISEIEPEAEAKTAKEAKRNRPITVKRIKVG